MYLIIFACGRSCWGYIAPLLCPRADWCSGYLGRNPLQTSTLPDILGKVFAI